MKKINLFMLLILSIFSIVFLTGCDFQKMIYNIKIMEEYGFVDGFLEEHITDDCYYLDPLTNEYMLSNHSLPDDYTFIIKTKEDYEKIFKNTSKVNFDKEMLIVYIYSGIYSSKTKISEVDLDEGELSIDFRHKLIKFPGSATMPTQKHIVFKMDKVNFHSVDIDED